MPDYALCDGVSIYMLEPWTEIDLSDCSDPTCFAEATANWERNGRVLLRFSGKGLMDGDATMPITYWKVTDVSADIDCRGNHTYIDSRSPLYLRDQYGYAPTAPAYSADPYYYEHEHDDYGWCDGRALDTEENCNVRVTAGGGR